MVNKSSLVGFNIAAITVSKNQGLDLGTQPVNAITFVNLGTSIVTINGGIILNPGVPGTSNGESIAIPGNQGEFFEGRIDVSFAGGVGLLLAILKFYV